MDAGLTTAIKLPDGRSFRGEQPSLVAEEARNERSPALHSEELHKGVVGGKIKDYRTRSNKQCRGIIIDWTPCANGAGVYVAGTSMVPLRKVCVSRMQRTCLLLLDLCKRAAPIEREIAKVREIMNVTNGEYGYCSGSSRDDLRACNVGEGYVRGGRTDSTPCLRRER